jgi:cyanate permease
MLSGSFDPTFWTRLVLQAAYHEPSIRHAVIALGALHETSDVESTQESTRLLAMQQYGKAMTCLVNPTIQTEQRQTAHVALVACVLFVCFEVGYLFSPSD